MVNNPLIRPYFFWGEGLTLGGGVSLDSHSTLFGVEEIVSYPSLIGWYSESCLKSEGPPPPLKSCRSMFWIR